MIWPLKSQINKGLAHFWSISISIKICFLLEYPNLDLGYSNEISPDQTGLENKQVQVREIDETEIQWFL